MVETKLSILVVTYNTKDYLDRCLTSLYETVPLQLISEVVVVDDNSSDGTEELVQEKYNHPSLIFLKNRRTCGYARTNNRGYVYCRGEIVLLLNADIVLLPGSVLKAWSFLTQTGEEIGGVSGAFYSPDGSFQWAHKHFPPLRVFLWERTWLGLGKTETKFLQYYRMKEWTFRVKSFIEQPPAAFFMFKRQCFPKVLFDERLTLYFNDVDLCRRLYQQGKKIVFLPEVKVIHYLGSSCKQLPPDLEKQAYYTDAVRYLGKYAKWQALIVKLWFILNYQVGLLSILWGILRGKRRREELLSRWRCFWDFLWDRSIYESRQRAK